jgi:hypothetical protein
VERAFNRVKNRHGLAVSSEKSGRNFLAAIQLPAPASACPVPDAGSGLPPNGADRSR